MRSFSGCWTCRLRRKKCDERRPICDACAALYITCNYDQTKPSWMDGGSAQKLAAEQLKREIKENARRRRGDQASSSQHRPGNVSLSSQFHDNLGLSPSPATNASSRHDSVSSAQPHHYDIGFEADDTDDTDDPSRRVRPYDQGSHGPYGLNLEASTFEGDDTLGQPETILLMFFLEHLLPFLFPFYRPNTLQGGKAWLLQLAMNDRVLRQAILCQSSYFFSLTWGAENRDAVWEKVLERSRDAFEMLRRAVQAVESSDITQRPHGAVQTLSSILQVQRFEMLIYNVDNCLPHLNAALALFERLVEVPQDLGAIPLGEPRSPFEAVMDRLGPSSYILPAQHVSLPSTEQIAFRFSTTLLILDDILVSTVLQEVPRLYKFHRDLLGDPTPGPDHHNIDLSTVIGCQNWVLLHIGEIAVLDNYKQHAKLVGTITLMDLVQRAVPIRNSVIANLARIEHENPAMAMPDQESNLFHMFSAGESQPLVRVASNQSSLVTKVWAHAALLYLNVVVAGWRPASDDIRHHVESILELLTFQISPNALLRTMIWPFCIAGCLALPEQEAAFRNLVEQLQPPSFFGSAYKGLEIMENVWRTRGAPDSVDRDLATCFRSQNGLVLLV